MIIILLFINYNVFQILEFSNLLLSLQISQAEEHNNNGKNYYKSGQYGDALREFNIAIQMNPQNVKYYNNRAITLNLLQRYYDALKDSQKCLQLDPEYEKGQQTLIDCYLNCNQLEKAQELAKKVYNRNTSTKNRQQMEKAERCIRIKNTIESDIETAMKKILVIVCKCINWMTKQQYPLVSSQSRSSNIQTSDDFELSVCKIMDAFYQGRQQLDEINIGNIEQDIDFWYRTVMTQKLSNDIMCKYYLLMAIYINITDRFRRFGILGYQHFDKINNDPQYYVKLLQSQMNSATNNIRNLIQCCLYLQREQNQNAIPLLQQLVRQYQDIQMINQSYSKFTQLKANGHKYYDQKNYQQAHQCFIQAAEQILQYNVFCNEEQVTISFPSCAIMLSILNLCSQGLSNAGMSVQSNQTGKAVCLLLSALLLTTNTHKINIRLANIFRDQQMFGEAAEQYGYAAEEDKNDVESLKASQNNKRQNDQYLRLDYYGILGVQKGVDTQSREYIKAYKKMAAKYHPDKYKDDLAQKRFAEKKFQQIQEANTVLTNEKYRRVYDAGGDPLHPDRQAGGMPDMGGFQFQGGPDITDIFSQVGGMFPFFQGGGMPGNVKININGHEFTPNQFNQGGNGQQRHQTHQAFNFDSLFEDMFNNNRF